MLITHKKGWVHDNETSVRNLESQFVLLQYTVKPVLKAFSE